MATLYERDKSGQWWAYSHGNPRTRAEQKLCQQCGREFVTRIKKVRFCSTKCSGLAKRVDRQAPAWRDPRSCRLCNKTYVPTHARQVFCSHGCAATTYHSRRSVTTEGARGDIINADNPRYSKDERGQWWYKPIGTKDHPRTRAYVKTCGECGQEFLNNIFNRAKQVYCSKRCGLLAFNKSNPDRFKKANSGRWKGGKQVRGGYVFVHTPDHPSCQGNLKLYVAEHRLVMEKMLGRYLESHEQVHHKNGIRDDNRPENLELWAHQQPKGQRVDEQQTKHCPTCTCHLTVKG